MSNNEDVILKIMETLGQAGTKKLGGMSLENPDPNLLDHRTGDLNDHVAMQPVAVAYYGGLRTEVEQNLLDKKMAFDRWKKVKYAEAFSVAKGEMDGKKPTEAQIESIVHRDNQVEFEKWEAEISALSARLSWLTVWVDAWKQKGYTLNSVVEIAMSEMRTQPYRGKMEEEGGRHLPPSRALADQMRKQDIKSAINNLKNGNNKE